MLEYSSPNLEYINKNDNILFFIDIIVIISIIKIFVQRREEKRREEKRREEKRREEKRREELLFFHWGGAAK